MDVYTAVFNCHVNAAHERAVQAFIDTYGTKRFEQYIEPYLNQGIMSIFNDPPNRYTKFFCFYIKRVVNSA